MMRNIRKALVLCALFLMSALAAPVPAHADSYPNVRIEASVLGNGSLRVVETRAFRFDDDGNGVYWTIPLASNEQGAASSVAIDGVMVDDGEARVFTQVPSAELGNDGVYTVEQASGTCRLMVYAPHAEDDVQLVSVGYTITGAVMAWEDTAELYWQFVGADWQDDSEDVELVVRFPDAESGSATVGEDFRAWGHGPLDGAVALDADIPQVTYRVPCVATGEFAEARVAFPLAWVPQLAASSKASSVERLPTILEEERAWADEANALRQRAREQRTFLGAGMVAVPALFTMVLVALRCLRRESKPQFAETYCDDVPSHDHPAVLAAFTENGAVTERALVSTLMKLTAEGVVGIQDMEEQRRAYLERARGTACADDPFADEDTAREGETRTESRQYRLELLQPARKDVDDIDGAALRLFFRTSKTTASFSSLGSYKNDNPKRYEELRIDFVRKVSDALEARRLIASKGTASAVASIAIGGVLAAFAFIIGIIEALWIPMAAAIVLAIAGMVVGAKIKRLTPEGVELRARCVAFTRWLEDFTTLHAAVPEDLCRWNNVLVCAVALGVSAELVRDLALLAPIESIAAADWYPSYWWYLPGDGRRVTPVQHASNVCVLPSAAAAASGFSSGGGGGGGFSGGGGGGVGGGGGGSF